MDNVDCIVSKWRKSKICLLEHQILYHCASVMFILLQSKHLFLSCNQKLSLRIFRYNDPTCRFDTRPLKFHKKLEPNYDNPVKYLLGSSDSCLVFGSSMLFTSRKLWDDVITAMPVKFC